MTKYIHVVFVKHDELHRKTFLFEVPTTTTLKKGQEVAVHTIHGIQEGKCACNSFVISEYALKNIVDGVGAQLPLEQVLGIVELETIRRKYLKRFPELDFEEVED